RHVEASANIDAIARSHRGIDISRGRKVWLFADDIDSARNRVASEQRSLRSAQHLHMIEIEKVEDRTVDQRIIGIVDIEGDARFSGEARVALADAAHEGGKPLAELTAGLAEGRIRHDG